VQAAPRSFLKNDTTPRPVWQEIVDFSFFQRIAPRPSAFRSPSGTASELINRIPYDASRVMAALVAAIHGESPTGASVSPDKNRAISDDYARGLSRAGLFAAA
jgi:hypothetical protein